MRYTVRYNSIYILTMVTNNTIKKEKETSKKRRVDINYKVLKLFEIKTIYRISNIIFDHI